MTPFLNRRHFLTQATTGLSSIALASLLEQQRLLADSGPIRPNIDPAQPFASS